MRSGTKAVFLTLVAAVCLLALALLGGIGGPGPVMETAAPGEEIGGIVGGAPMPEALPRPMPQAMPEAMPEPVILPADDGEAYHEVQLYYATNRALANAPDPDHPTSRYTNAAGALSYGTAMVSIPRDHRKGHLETQGWLMSLVAAPDPEKHVILHRLDPLDRAALLALVKDDMAQTDDAVLLYVHGFNTPMDLAARRAGQLTYDLDWTGPSFFFSWPSRGQTTAYTVDQTMAELSEGALLRLLTDLAELNAGRVVVIAHSMGTQILTQAMVRLHDRDPQVAERVTTIVLAAPDIDAALFMAEVLPVFQALPRTKVTLYASSEDTALKASHAVNGFTRIGDTTRGVPVLAGIDVIDATGAESDFFGHTYFGDNPTIVEDIFAMLRDGAPPAARAGLRGVPDAGGPTWAIVARP